MSDTVFFVLDHGIQIYVIHRPAVIHEYERLRVYASAL